MKYLQTTNSLTCYSTFNTNKVFTLFLPERYNQNTPNEEVMTGSGNRVFGRPSFEFKNMSVNKIYTGFFRIKNQ